ncbi:hypothetical protein BpHYR1_013003 [Brachionus plicatilis]|uniref:Uncharacterized protein n=1 Tax=Brachionus plicatilis TaxID=10195 RepID=A0A3M7QFL2_BRAPC|nr:hypothetical protein BpHYR1_013003 [Brachionus plicatilis]
MGISGNGKIKKYQESKSRKEYNIFFQCLSYHMISYDPNQLKNKTSRLVCHFQNIRIIIFNTVKECQCTQLGYNTSGFSNQLIVNI